MKEKTIFINIITKKNFIPNDSKLNPHLYTGHSIRRWHTSDRDQEILADLWYNYILDNNFLTNKIDEHPN